MEVRAEPWGIPSHRVGRKGDLGRSWRRTKVRTQWVHRQREEDDPKERAAEDRCENVCAMGYLKVR